MSWQEQFDKEQLAVIKDNWKGPPPPQCNGACCITNYFLSAGCKACGWCDEPATDGLDTAYDE